ncbi:MAG: hypothetical protein AAGJ10_09745 [Bacteroidota bacterium]
MTRVVLSLLALCWGCSSPPPPGVLAPDPPVQVSLSAEPLAHRGYTLLPVATFEVTARVLGVEGYHGQRHGRLAPYDIALGWGLMSDTAVLERLDIAQHDRLYRWSRRDGAPDTPTIIRHSTNIHIVPASSGLGGRVASLRHGDVVTLRGQLVDALAPDGSQWRTSRSRTDAGMGACEILWLEAVETRSVSGR